MSTSSRKGFERSFFASPQGSLSLQSGQVLTTGRSLTNAGIVTVGTGSGLSLRGSYTQKAGTTTIDGTLTAPTGLTLQKGSFLGKGKVSGAMISDASVTAGGSATKPGILTVSGSNVRTRLEF